MYRQQRLVVLLAAALAVAGPLAADTNRFFNPDFDENTLGWDDITGENPFWFSDDRNLCPGSGSAYNSAALPGGFLRSATSLTGKIVPVIPSVAFSQVIPAFGGEILFLHAEALVHGAQPVLSSITVIACNSAGCAPRIDSAPVSLPRGSWTRVSMPPVTVPVGSDFAGVIFNFVSLGTLDVRLDRVYGSTVDEVFADGFELGETCRWSITVP
jgi:hypothetical protein